MRCRHRGETDRSRLQALCDRRQVHPQDRVGTTKLRLAAFVPARLLVAGTYRLQSILLDSAGAAHTLYTSLRIVIAPAARTCRATPLLAAAAAAAKDASTLVPLVDALRRLTVWI